jgi:phage terminase small subunit
VTHNFHTFQWSKLRQETDLILSIICSYWKNYNSSMEAIKDEGFSVIVSFDTNFCITAYLVK